MVETASGLSTLPPRHTLFFALLPGAAVREAMAAAVEDIVAGQGLRARRIEPARYHATVHFLGGFPALPVGLVEAACAAAGRVACPRFELAFDRVGGFRAAPPPCVLLASQVPEPLSVLWRELGEALSQAGVPLPASRRCFVPHVTFAYAHREAARPVAIAPVAWPVDGFALLRRERGAAHDETLGYWPLLA